MDQTMATVVTATASLLGVGLGGWITYIVTLKTARRQFLREKYAEVHDLALQVYQWLDNKNNSWWNAWVKQNGLNNSLPLYNVVKDQDLPCPIDKLEMLIGWYIPKLEKAF